MPGPDVYARGPGRFYNYYIERPRIGRVVGRVLWGSDFGPLYAGLERLGRLPRGITVLDAACGSGLIFPWLGAQADVCLL